MDFADKEERRKFFSEVPDDDDDKLARHLAYAFAVSGTLPCEGVVKSNAEAVCKGVGRATSGRLQWDKEGHIPLKDSLRRATEAHMTFAKAVAELAGDHPKRGEVTKAFLFRDEQGLLDFPRELEGEWEKERKKLKEDIDTAEKESKKLEEEADNLQGNGRRKEADDKQKEAEKRLNKVKGMRAKIQKKEDQHESLFKGLLRDPKEGKKQALDRAKEMDLSDLKEVMANAAIKHAKYTSEECLDDFFKKLVLMMGQDSNSELEARVKDRLKGIPGCEYAAYKTNLEKDRSNKWISPSTVVKNSNLILNRKVVSMEASFHGVHSAMDEITFNQLICEKWPEIGERLPDLLEPYISRNLERLEQPSSSQEKTSFEEEEFFRMMVQEPDASQKDQVVFIPGEPGMGKTTFAERLAQEWKKTHPLHWVFLLTLQELVKLPDLTDKDGKIMTHKALRLDSHYKQRLFEENSDRAILLLDDLDEIPFDMQGKVLEWIKEARLSFGRVFITGRLGTQTIVHRHLSEQKKDSILKRFYWILRFLPFTKEKQAEFYTAWWKQRLSVDDSQEDKVKEYVEDTVTESEENSEMFSFVGIPLLTHMVAVIYEDKLRTFLSGGEKETIDGSSDVDGLYANFIKKKWVIFRQKYLENVNFEAIIDVAKKHFLHLHTHLAFETMFRGRLQLSCRQSGSQCEDYYGQEEMRKMAMPYGIVKNQRREDGGGDVFDFQHRSFSEYLAALFIVEGMAKEKTHTHRDAALQAYKLIFCEEDDSAQ